MATRFLIRVSCAFTAIALFCAPAQMYASSVGTDSRDSVRVSHNVEFDIRPGYLFQTSPFFKGENMSGNPMRGAASSHLRYSFGFDGNYWQTDNMSSICQGIGISYNSFFNTREIGNPVAVYVFQRAGIVSVLPGLSLDLEWDFGLSFGWRPFNVDSPGSPDYNEFNTVVGSRINAYIGLGILLDYEISPEWSLVAGVDLSHYSNGNTSYPNSGVNTLGARLGVVRSFNVPTSRDRLDRFLNYGHISPDSQSDSRFLTRVSWDLIFYGSCKFKGVKLETDPFLVPGKFAVAGMNLSPMYSFSRLFKAGLSLDAQYDESANIAGYAVNPWDPETKFYRPPFTEQLSVGVSARVELAMPIFSINFGIGRNFVCTGPDTDGFYQIAALKASLTSNLFIHIGYQLYNFHVPNNLMLGIGYRFNSKN